MVKLPGLICPQVLYVPWPRRTLRANLSSLYAVKQSSSRGLEHCEAPPHLCEDCRPSRPAFEAHTDFVAPAYATCQGHRGVRVDEHCCWLSAQKCPRQELQVLLSQLQPLQLRPPLEHEAFTSQSALLYYVANLRMNSWT